MDEGLKEMMDKHYRKLEIQATDNIIRKIYEENLTENFHAQKFGGKLQQLFNETIELKKIRHARDKKDYYGFFTFSFREGTKLDEATKFINKVVSKSWMDEWYYTYEQRGETNTEAGKGLHIHLLFKRVLKPSHTNREIYNTFKHLTDIKESILFKTAFKYYPKKFKEDKIDYMSGKKWDDDKHQKTIIDKYFRDINSLELLYSYNI